MNSVMTKIKCSQEKINVGDMFELCGRLLVVIGRPFKFTIIDGAHPGRGASSLKIPMWDTVDNYVRWEYLSDILDPKVGFKPVKNQEITITFKS